MASLPNQHGVATSAPPQAGQCLVLRDAEHGGHSPWSQSWRPGRSCPKRFWCGCGGLGTCTWREGASTRLVGVKGHKYSGVRQRGGGGQGRVRFDAQAGVQQGRAG